MPGWGTALYGEALVPEVLRTLLPSLGHPVPRFPAGWIAGKLCHLLTIRGMA
jgi:hypothetical protein